MKLVGYTRVSTNKQADQGFGLEVQADQITRWARDHRHKIVGWYRDEGESGTDPGRLGLLDAIAHAKTADGLVVPRLDRLARDVVLQETFLGELRRAGSRMHSCDPSEDALLVDDDTDPTRKLMRQLLGAIADYERALIRMRMEAGRARKIAAGGYAWGAPPYGYIAEGGELVPDPIQQSVLDMIWTLDQAGTSERKIAATLMQGGVPAAKGGAVWHANTIRRIVNRLRKERSEQIAAP